MILRWRILRSKKKSPEAENSSPENSSPDDSSPDNSSLGYFFARKIHRRTILRRKNLYSDDSSPFWPAKTVFANNNNILTKKNFPAKNYPAKNFPP
jgi:hypothetical protein